MSHGEMRGKQQVMNIHATHHTAINCPVVDISPAPTRASSRTRFCFWDRWICVCVNPSLTYIYAPSRWSCSVVEEEDEEVVAESGGCC